MLVLTRARTYLLSPSSSPHMQYYFWPPQCAREWYLAMSRWFEDRQAICKAYRHHEGFGSVIRWSRSTASTPRAFGPCVSASRRLGRRRRAAGGRWQRTTPNSTTVQSTSHHEAHLIDDVALVRAVALLNSCPTLLALCSCFHRGTYAFFDGRGYLLKINQLALLACNGLRVSSQNDRECIQPLVDVSSHLL